MSFIFRLDRRITIAIAGAMLILLMPSIALSATITIAWDKPDSSAIAGYKLYYGESHATYKQSTDITINGADITEYTIEDLEYEKTYWFAATSHDGNGRESDFSNEISHTISMPTYTVEMTISNGSGFIRFAGDDCKTYCTADFEYNSSPAFTIVPDNGFQISDVLIDGSSAGAISSHTFEKIKGNHSITALFSRKEYTISASASGGGTIDPSGDISVLHNESKSFSITASDGYKFTGLYINEDPVGLENPYTFTGIDRNHNIHATFTTISSGGSPGDDPDTGDDNNIGDDPDDGNTDDGNGTGNDPDTGNDVDVGDEPDNDDSGADNDAGDNPGIGDDNDVGDGPDDGNTDDGNGTGNDPDTGNDVDVGDEPDNDDSGADNDAGDNPGIGDDNDVGDGPDNGDIGEAPGDDVEVPAEQLPDTPLLIEPKDNAILYPGEPLYFESDIYSHPEGNVHSASRWQIRRVDKKNYFYDEITEESTVHEDSTTKLKTGLKYAWRVGFQHAGSDQYAWSEERQFVMGEEIVDDKTPPVNRGQARKDFKMISFTHWTDNDCSENTFSPLLESDYTHGDYRIATYDPTLDAGGGYREYGNFEVVPGRAFWILARNGIDLTRKGVPVSTEEDIHVPLPYNASTNNGWSMIAVPNNAVYSWGDMEVHVFDNDGNLMDGPKLIRQLSKENLYIDKRIWEWKNGTVGKYESHDSNDFQLKPHTGYWVKTRSSNVTLVFPHDMQVDISNPGFNPRALLPGWWHAGIDWIGEKLSPGSVFADLSSDGIEPPMPLDGLSDNPSDESPSNSDANCFIGTISGKHN